MDISSHLDHFNSVTENYDMLSTAFFGGGLFGMMVVILVSVLIGSAMGKKNDGVNILPLIPGTILGVCVMVFGIINAGSYGDRTEPRNELSAAVSAEAGEHYGVEIPAEKVDDAFMGENHDVVDFGAEHDGSDKALSLRIDKDAKTVTVYQGNVELEPSN